MASLTSVTTPTLAPPAATETQLADASEAEGERAIEMVKSEAQQAKDDVRATAEDSPQAVRVHQSRGGTWLT